jgi:hypothetical protein
VGGWLARGGAGIGSHAYGWFAENVLAAAGRDGGQMRARKAAPGATRRRRLAFLNELSHEQVASTVTASGDIGEVSAAELASMW